MIGQFMGTSAIKSYPGYTQADAESKWHIRSQTHEDRHVNRSAKEGRLQNLPMMPVRVVFVDDSCITLND